MAIHTDVNRRSIDMQNRQISSRKNLQGAWSCVVPPDPANPEASVWWTAKWIRRAARVLLSSNQAAQEDSIDDGVEQIPRKERPRRRHRFRRKREERNWLKICLTKAFHNAKSNASRSERRRFERESTVWRWVRKYRQKSARQSQWKAIIERWSEGYTPSGREIENDGGLPKAFS